MPVISANHLSNLEIQRQCNFSFTCQTLGNLGEEMVQSCKLPGFGLDIAEVRDVNLVRKFAKAVKFPDVEVEFLDSPERDVAGKLEEWFAKIWDGQSLHPKSEYKEDCTVTLHAADGSGERSWTLKDAFPASIDLGTGNMGSDAPALVRMVLSVDEIERA